MLFRRLDRSALAWLAVGVLAAMVIQPLMGSPPKGHDTLLHFYRIPAIRALWERGIFFSRWVPDLIYGYGSPLFAYYPPLSAYLLTAIDGLLGGNAPVAFNVVSALSLAVGAVGMFGLGRDLYGKVGGVFAASAYILSPHFLYQVFARTSISNALAMAFMPVAAWGVLRVARHPTPRRVVVASLALAAVLLSHTSTSAIFAVPLALVGLAGALAAPEKDAGSRSRLPWVIMALALGAAVAAFCWLPALAELGYTRYELVTGPTKVDYREHFSQVWAWPERAIADMVNAPLPKSVGVGQLLLGSGGLVLALSGLAKRVRSRSRHGDMALPVTILAGLLGFGSIFMSSSASAWLWEHVELLRRWQFPWRWLDIGAFFVALAAGHLALAARRWKAWRVALLAAGLVTFFANAIPYLYPPRRDDLVQKPTLADVTWVQQRHGIHGLTSWGEYSSRTVPALAWPQEPPFLGADLGAPLQAKLRQADLPPGSVVASAKGGPLHADLRISLPLRTAITFDCHYFPGWKATVDGRSAPVEPDAAGRLLVRVPPGEHAVSVRWGRTPVRWFADGLSILGGLVLAAAWIWPRQRETSSGARPAINGKEADTAPLLALAAIMVALAVSKVAWLDHHSSFLLAHPDPEGIPGIPTPAQGDFGGLARLVGYKVERPDGLTLYWVAEKGSLQRLEVVIELWDVAGRVVETVVNPYPGHNVTESWVEGQLTRDEYTFPEREAWAEGGYRTSVSLRDAETETWLPVLDSPDGTQDRVIVESPEKAARKAAALDTNTP